MYWIVVGTCDLWGQAEGGDKLRHNRAPQHTLSRLRPPLSTTQLNAGWRGASSSSTTAVCHPGNMLHVAEHGVEQVRQGLVALPVVAEGAVNVGNGNRPEGGGARPSRIGVALLDVEVQRVDPPGRG